MDNVWVPAPGTNQKVPVLRPGSGDCAPGAGRVSTGVASQPLHHVQPASTHDRQPNAIDTVQARRLVDDARGRLQAIAIGVGT